MFRWRIRQGCPVKKRRRQFMAVSILWARWFPWIDWSVESFWCWVRIFNINLIPKKKNRLKSPKSFIKVPKKVLKIVFKIRIRLVCFYDKSPQKSSKKVQIVFMIIWFCQYIDNFIPEQKCPKNVPNVPKIPDNDQFVDKMIS